MNKSPVSAVFSQIPWDSLGALKLTAQETALLRMAETNEMTYTLSDSRDASMYARVLLKLLSEAAAAGAGTGEVSKMVETVVSEEEAQQALNADPLGVVCHYALSKLWEILETLGSGLVKGVSIASVFYVGKDGVLVDQWKALLRLLNKNGKGDFYGQKMAALCLCKILVAACPSQRHSSTTDKDGNVIKARPVQYASAIEPLEAITAWIVSQLKNAMGTMVAICTPALKVLMEASESRTLFVKSGGIKYMARQMRVGSKAKSMSGDKKKIGQASVQQLYEIAFCMWILTYELNNSYAIRQDFAKESLAVQALVDLVSVAPREKVVRVALAALRNMATCVAEDSQPAGQTPINAKYFLSEMIACGLMKAIDYLRDRQFTDPDIVEDIDLLHKLLHDNYKEMSRWEVYKNEVESGRLQWGSCHTEAFFKENARMMEGSDGDFHLLKVLIALLSSHDEEVAAIACYDIGEFVRHYPNGRAIAKRLGAKELVMPLIEHENPELQRHALQCVSKIMVQHWEYVK